MKSNETVQSKLQNDFMSWIQRNYTGIWGRIFIAILLIVLGSALSSIHNFVQVASLVCSLLILILDPDVLLLNTKYDDDASKLFLKSVKPALIVPTTVVFGMWLLEMGIINRLAQNYFPSDLVNMQGFSDVHWMQVSASFFATVLRVEARGFATLIVALPTGMLASGIWLLIFAGLKRKLMK